MINPLWLQTFCTLVEAQHFTQTAQRLHMTQPGVSQHIHKLEQQLGHKLLQRQGKSFRLTHQGERLYQRGRQLLSQWQQLEQQVCEDRYDQGLVRIVSPGSVGLKLYPQCLKLQQQHPGLIIDYRFAPNDSIERALADGDADIGLLTQETRHPDLLCQALAQEPLLLVTADSEGNISWQRLMQLGFIDHPDGAYQARRLLNANFVEFESVSQLKISGFCNQIGLILEPVAHGLGFTVLPATAVAQFYKQQKIAAHQLNHAIAETIYLSQNKSSVDVARIEFLIQSVRACLSEQ